MDGISIYFWFDNWSNSGRLIDIYDDSSNHIMGIHRIATISYVVNECGWNLWRCQNLPLHEITLKIWNLPPPTDQAGHDVWMWKSGVGEFKNSFSSKTHED